MNILFLAHHKHPRIGGVEKHIQQITKKLKVEGHKITTISEEDLKPPHIKIFGLLYIWFWLFKNRKLVSDADIVHVHDVFIWYLPFRLLFPQVKVYITFHGWEGTYPIPLWNILNKRTANYLCNGSIAVGNYINKYYGIKSDFVIHGGVSNNQLTNYHKTPNSLVWFGRQDKDTGYFEFREWLKTKPHLKVKYITNIKNPEKYLKMAVYCVPSGYLSYLEAKSYGCKIITFANNPLKEDYWKEIKKVKSIPTWSKIGKNYLNLWSIR